MPCSLPFRDCFPDVESGEKHWQSRFLLGGLMGLMLGLMLMLGACSSAVPPGVLAVVHEHLAATERVDLPAFAATLHPQSPAREPLLEGVQQLEGVELQVTTLAVHWRGRDASDRGLVEVRQQIKARRPGSSPTQSEVRGRIVLVQEGEAWKVWNVEVLDVQFLPTTENIR